LRGSKPIYSINKMRKKIVAGNWKMNLDVGEAQELFKAIIEIEPAKGVQVTIFPPAVYLDRFLTGFPSVASVGAQNAYFETSGAFTGEIAMQQLRSLGVHAVLVGHSERRMLFGEDHVMLKKKTDAALKNGLQPFFCCGEPLEVREANEQEAYVRKQLDESLFHLAAEEFEKTVIAYEPVWAIGTGVTATSQQAEEMHAAIRSWVSDVYGETIADKTTIIYGGSCNPSNAAALFACPNVDGGLIGGASLNSADFATLVAAETWTI